SEGGQSRRIPTGDHDASYFIGRINVGQIEDNHPSLMFGENLPDSLASNMLRIVNFPPVFGVIEAREIKDAMFIRLLACHEGGPRGCRYRRHYRGQFGTQTVVQNTA